MSTTDTRATVEPPKVLQTTESFWTDDGVEIPALVYRPPQLTALAPAVAVYHGGPGRNAMKSEEHISSALAAAGFIAVAGTYRSGLPATHDDDDVSACLAYMSGLDGVDPSRIGMVGHSRGGAATLRAASEQPLLRSVCSLAAGVGMDQLTEKIRSHCQSRHVELLRYFGGSGRRDPSFSPREDRVATIDIPVLLVHGTRDFNAAPDGSVAAYQILHDAGNSRARLELLEGVDHFWGHASGPQHDRVAAMVVEWFQQTLGSDDAVATNGAR